MPTSAHFDRARFPLTLVGVVMGALALATLAVLSGAITHLDFHAVSGIRDGGGEEPFNQWAFLVTWLGDTHSILFLSVVAVFALAWMRHWRGAMALAVSVGATEAIVALVKLVISRPRPPGGEALTQAGGSSFPSGHAAAAVALYALLAYIVSRSCEKTATRVAVLVAGGVVVLGIGLSRVYLGVHYPSDVIAGWLTGGAIVLVSWGMATRLRAPRVTAF
jgi:undecaprenyl-diphosphatase